MTVEMVRRRFTVDEYAPESPGAFRAGAVMEAGEHAASVGAPGDPVS